MYDTSNFFAILPSSVRYNPNLSPRAKILYAAVTSLAKSGGEAYASNKYLSDVLDTSERNVIRLLSELTAEKFISIRYEYRSGTREVLRRLIRVNDLPLLLDLSVTQTLYAVIPSHILAMRELSVQAKLLYAEISAATPTDGFCSKPASFFAEILHTAVSTVRRWIKELQDVHALRVEMEYKGDTREIKRRRIYLTVCAEIAERQADLGDNGSETLGSGISPNAPDAAYNPNCGRNRGMLIFDTTSHSEPVRPRKLRRKRKKAVENLRL